MRNLHETMPQWMGGGSEDLRSNGSDGCQWSTQILRQLDQQGIDLVAVTSAYSNFVTPLGASAAKHSCAGLGLHAGKKPVGLRPVAAVWLEGTLRHLTRLLLNLSLRFATVSQYTRNALFAQADRSRRPSPHRSSNQKLASNGDHARDRKSIFTRNGAINYLSPDDLKSTWFSVLLSNPLTKDDFQFAGSRFGSRCRFSSQWRVQNRGEDLQQTVFIATRPVGAGRDIFCLCSHCLCPWVLG